ncbi:hypothetical protein BX600DRAFT_518163 [Xylariales sp. PMI_506]|nr:hypothetical protein BX600DRAFT_518163 [Xylariales sp. PMI_506]
MAFDRRLDLIDHELDDACQPVVIVNRLRRSRPPPTREPQENLKTTGTSTGNSGQPATVEDAPPEEELERLTIGAVTPPQHTACLSPSITEAESTANTSDMSLSFSSDSYESSAYTESYVDKKKNEILDRVILSVVLWLKSKFRQAYQGSCQFGQPVDAENNCTSSATQQPNPDVENSASGKKRKLINLIGDSPDRAGDDDGSRKESGKGGSKSSKGKSPEVQRFACPYFKYHPTKYKDWRNCPGPGWTDIHRVKEHLYRRHRQPKHRCGRCWEPFEDEQSYLHHSRSAEPCALRPMEPAEGFDARQESRLKSRKKIYPEATEYQKWRRIFNILFPHVLEQDIPSPFYEYDQAGDLSDSHACIKQCENYVLREVPSRLRMALEPQLNMGLTIVEESMRRTASECVRNLLRDVFHEFRELQRRESPQDTTTATGSATSAVAMAEEVITAEARSLDISSPDQPMDEEMILSQSFDAFNNDFDFSFDIFDMPTMQGPLAFAPQQHSSSASSRDMDELKFSDSGYASNGSKSGGRAMTERKSMDSL